MNKHVGVRRADWLGDRGRGAKEPSLSGLALFRRPSPALTAPPTTLAPSTPSRHLAENGSSGAGFAKHAGSGSPLRAQSMSGAVVWTGPEFFASSGLKSFEGQVQKAVVLPGQGTPPAAVRCALGCITSPQRVALPGLHDLLHLEEKTRHR